MITPNNDEDNIDTLRIYTLHIYRQGHDICELSQTRTRLITVLGLGGDLLVCLQR